MIAHSLHSFTYLCQLGQDAVGGKKGGGGRRGKAKANLVVTVKAGIYSAGKEQARKE